MEKKVIYILRHLGAPQKKRSKEFEKVIKESEKYFDITIYQGPFGQREMTDNSENRFFFRFPRYKKDNPKAMRIGESILLGAEISFGPLSLNDFLSQEPIYAFPSYLFSKKGFITFDELVNFEKSKPYDQRAIEFPNELYTACWLSEFHVLAAWRIARVLFNDQDLLNGANFLKSSQQKFHVLPEQLEQAIGNTSTAIIGWEQTNLEDALINAYKTIEAVIGDIPKDDKKIFFQIKTSRTKSS